MNKHYRAGWDAAFGADNPSYNDATDRADDYVHDEFEPPADDATADDERWLFSQMASAKAEFIRGWRAWCDTGIRFIA